MKTFNLYWIYGKKIGDIWFVARRGYGFNEHIKIDVYFSGCDRSRDLFHVCNSRKPMERICEAW